MKAPKLAIALLTAVTASAGTINSILPYGNGTQLGRSLAPQGTDGLTATAQALDPASISKHLHASQRTIIALCPAVNALPVPPPHPFSESENPE